MSRMSDLGKKNRELASENRELLEAVRMLDTYGKYMHLQLSSMNLRYYFDRNKEVPEMDHAQWYRDERGVMFQLRGTLYVTLDTDGQISQCNTPIPAPVGKLTKFEFRDLKIKELGL